jgi:prepilin signal peptidase PulO-like enzyme (type II secretory pathway)
MPYAIAVAAAVGVVFVALAVSDARTSQVPILGSQIATALAIAGLGLVSLVEREWPALVGAVAGAALIAGIQLLPYLVQRRSGRAWIGAADVRLAVPFGWTLGWFDLSYAMIGFAVALVSGLIASVVLRRSRLPFVPCLALGLWLGLVLAVLSG